MSKSGGRTVRKKPRPYRRFAVVGLLVVAGVSAALYRFTHLPPVAIYLVAISLCAFLLCGYDKQVAGSDRTRVPENVLFGIALLGGTFGLLLGMNVFRHKTRKVSFQIGFGVVMVIQAVVAYVYLL